MIFLTLSEKMIFLFPENMISFFRRKMKDDLSKRIKGKMIFSVYSVKLVFHYPTNMTISFYQKNKDDLLPKNMHNEN